MPRLEAFGVMQDKPVVTGVINSFIDVGFPWEIVRDSLLKGSVSTKTTENDMDAYC